MKNLRKLLVDNIYLLFFIISVFIFFYPFILQGKIPIPADTIVGMYHPWRDVVWSGYKNGVPFKNFLITDPVRQQYVWRNLAISNIKKGELPLWNPYSFSGMPLIANFQSAVFYPLNIIFFILPFNLAWGILILLEPLLSGIFLFLYLRNLNISKDGSLIGSIVFAFSGFSIAWLEWNTIVHTVLWLPLILLAKDKLISKFSWKWVVILIFSEASSFFAGHLQIFFYSLIVSNVYLILRVYMSVQVGKLHQNFIFSFVKKYLPFVWIGAVFVIITSIQWLPTLRFILASARDYDLSLWAREGWFLPWQNLIQFVIPDFFGNPATNNYWGIWNYGEFIGYIGIIPLILALYGILFRRDKKTLFFSSFVLVSLIFALPTPFAKLPFQWQIPFISTSQPTRLLFLVDFSLAVLAALGFDYFIKNKNSIVQIFKPLILVGCILGFLWFLILNNTSFSQFVIKSGNLEVAKRNLLLPSGLFITAIFFLSAFSLIKKRQSAAVMISIIIVAVIFDLFRFGWKFTPFSPQEWIFPTTSLLEKVNTSQEEYRIMALDRRILPPNFSVAYGLNDVSGYDPLYLKNYSQLVSAWERNKPDISPASFNRILTPQNYDSFIADLLGVKYILSFQSINSEKLTLIGQQGNTFLYKNRTVFPRVFFAEDVIKTSNPQNEIDKMFLLKDELRRIAVTGENLKIIPKELSSNEYAKFTQYSENQIIIQTKSEVDRLLVLTDIYYPAWKVTIDDNPSKIYKVDLVFRGVVIPEGEHLVKFKIDLL